MQEMEEKMRSALLTFIDILYAVVYGLILVQMFDQVIMPAKPVVEKANNVLLVIGVFYFLTWDWLHGRRLTLKNPYTSYRRFYMEVFIAFLAYGAALNALRVQIFFLLYILLGLLTGAIWARSTLKEYPESEDKLELRIIQRLQTTYTIAGTLLYLHWYIYVRRVITVYESVLFIVIGYIFVLTYDILVERPDGLMGGPGVPLISRNIIKRIQRFLFR